MSPLVTMRTIMAGPSCSADVGQTIDVDAKTARALVDAGYAVLQAAPEAAVIVPTETGTTAPHEDAMIGPSESAVVRPTKTRKRR